MIPRDNIGYKRVTHAQSRFSDSRLRFQAEEKRRQQRKRIIIVTTLALLLYAGIWVIQLNAPKDLQQLSTYTAQPSISQQSTTLSHPSSMGAAHTSINHRSSVTHHQGTPHKQSSIIRSQSPITVFRTSSAQVRSVSFRGTQASSSAIMSTRNCQLSTVNCQLSIVKYQPSPTPALAVAFNNATEQTVARKAGRRSGFVDDPDPQDPADPLATDPFAEDPDPITPADPLTNDTPVGGGIVLLLCLASLYALRLRDRLHIPFYT